MEKITKSFPALISKIDSDLGIVEAIVAVMGHVDFGDDRIWSGAFTKTLTERGNKVRVLNQHNMDDVFSVVGKPIEIREIGSNELPIELKNKYPSANGGLYTKTQYLIDTPEGLGVFNRIKAGALDEYSIGFSIPKGKQDFTNEMINGQMKSIRNIREVILFEYSSVIFGMQEATTTVSAKDNNMDEIGLKKRSIIQTYMDITDSFNSQYMNWDEYTGFYVNDIFTDGTLVCKATNIQTEYDYYQVNWQEIDGDYVFDPIENWQGGNFTFVIGLKSYDIIEETKQGRVLSQRNYDKIKNACDMLTEVMNAAMPMADDEEIPDDMPMGEDKNDQLAKSPEALTKNRDERLKEIELFIKNLDNLGVH